MNHTYHFELNSKPGKDGRHTILLRITTNRKHKRIKTDIAVKPTEFDPKAEWGKWVRSRNMDNREINARLKEILTSAETERLVGEKAGGSTPQTQPGTVWRLGAFIDRLVGEAASLSVGYQRNLKSRLSGFVEFAGKDLPLTSIDLDLLNRFKRKLQARGSMGGTQKTYFVRIKRMTSEALKLELIQKDPFLHFDMPKEQPAPRLKLSDEQVKAIEDVDVVSRRTDALGRSYQGGVWLFRAKYMYLFAYQMGGIRSRDIIQLRFGNLVGPKGAERLEYQMSKTGEFMSTRLTRKAREILDLFQRANATPGSYIFGALSDQAAYAEYITHEQKKKMPRELAVMLFNHISSVQTQINGELKELAKRAGITDKLTFHTARHSFADKARRKMKESKNISIDDIRQALGHSKLDTTQRYLNSFDREGLDSAMDAIFGED